MSPTAGNGKTPITDGKLVILCAKLAIERQRHDHRCELLIAFFLSRLGWESLGILDSPMHPEPTIGFQSRRLWMPRRTRCEIVGALHASSCVEETTWLSP